MNMPYEIEDILGQGDQGVIYQARDQDGTPLTLHRYLLPAELTLPLKEPAIWQSKLSELRSITAPHLRSVSDGGLDESDHHPWLVHPNAEEARPLDQFLADHSLNAADSQALRQQASETITALGENAQALALDPRDILISPKTEAPADFHFILDFRRWLLIQFTGLENLKERDLQAEIAQLAPGPSAPSGAKPLLRTAASPGPAAAAPAWNPSAPRPATPALKSAQ
ncbi:MAG: hypothetical protein ACQKBY_01160, partial [Verrucomicrobiales bacterium]